jgi:hypothetical protein
MEVIFNILKTFIYLILSFIFIGLSYTGLNLFCSLILNGIGSLKSSMNVILFWFLFLLIGIIIFLLLWFVFKLVISKINELLTKICPYPKIGEWFVNLNVLLTLGWFLYNVWWVTTNTSSPFGIIVSIVVSFMGISLGKVITESTTSIFTKRKFKDYTYENMYEKIIEEIKEETKS